MKGFIPTGFLKTNVLSLIYLLDGIFRDEENSCGRTCINGVCSSVGSRETRSKLVESKLLQLLCLTTRVMRLSGMIDSATIEVVKNLCNNFVANSPPHLRQHHKEMLAKDNQVFFD